MWDPVPWAIGGEAENSEDVARTLAYLALNGHEGVVSPGDLKVVPFDVPGAGVNVRLGVAGVLSKVKTRQAYVGRNPSVDAVAVPAQGSAGERWDMLVARILDPDVDDNAPVPADPVHGPFIRTELIPNVSPTATDLSDTVASGMAAIPLARIRMPANTGVVTAGQIVDLRDLANPRSERKQYPGTLNAKTITLSTSNWQAFPPGPVPGIYIPKWATHAAVELKTTLQYVSGDGYANFQSFLGTVTTANMWADLIIDTTSGAGGYRQPLNIAPNGGVWPIPSALRGTTQSITSRVQAKNQNGGKIASPTSDYYYVDVTFMEMAA